MKEGLEKGFTQRSPFIKKLVLGDCTSLKNRHRFDIVYSR